MSLILISFVYGITDTITEFSNGNNPTTLTFKESGNQTAYINVPKYVYIDRIYLEFNGGIYENTSKVPHVTINDSGGGSTSYKWGEIIIAKVNAIIYEVCTYTGFSGNRIYVYNNSQVVVSNASMNSTSKCGIVNYPIIGNRTYYILAGEEPEGGGFALRSKTEGIAYPYERTYLNYTAGTYLDESTSTWTNASTAIYNILNITVYKSSYPLNPSLEIGAADNNSEWNYTLGYYNISQGSNCSATSMNEVLNAQCTCTNCIDLGNDECSIPLTATSSSAGILNITILNISYEYGVDNCSKFNYPILNLTYFDEIERTAITVTNDYNLLFDGMFTQAVNGTFSNHAKDSFCTNIAPENRTLSWNTSGTFNVEKATYATNLYEIPIEIPIVTSNNPTYNQSLFLIPLANSTTVTFNWFTREYQPIDGTMLVYRCEGGGDRLLVSSTPIINSLATVNLELVTQAYSYDIIMGERLITNPDSFSRCHIESETDITYYVDIGLVNVTVPIGLTSVECSMNRTGVNTVKMEWDDNPFDDRTLTGCLFAYRVNINGNVLIHTNCTTNNVIERTIPVDNGFDYIVEGRLFQGGFSVPCDENVYFATIADTGSLVGLAGVFGIVLLIIAMALIWAGQKTKSLFGAGVGIVVVWLLGITKFGVNIAGWLTVGALIAFLVLIAWIGRSPTSQ